MRQEKLHEINLFHRIQEGSLRLFRAVRTTVTGPADRSSSENLPNNVYILQALESLLNKLRRRTGNFTRLLIPGREVGWFDLGSFS